MPTIIPIVSASKSFQSQPLGLGFTQSYNSLPSPTQKATNVVSKGLRNNPTTIVIANEHKKCSTLSDGRLR